MERILGAPWLPDQRSLLCQSGVVLRPVREHEMAMVQSFRRLQKAANVVAVDQRVGKHRALRQTSAKTLRNSVGDVSTLKPSCRRGSRVCKKPSRAEVVKREHKNVGSRISVHNICLKDVRSELPIGSVARKIGEGALEVRLECRTRAIKICKAALRHPWIHSPHCSEDGGLRWSCSKCGKKTAEPHGLFSRLSW